MKKLFLVFWILLGINLAYSQSKFDTASTILMQHLDGKNVKNFGFVTNGIDTLFMNNVNSISLLETKDKKIGIWPFDAKFAFTGTKETVEGPLISLSKTKSGNYTIDTVKFYYLLFDNTPFETKVKYTKINKTIDNFKEIYFSFEDGSSFRFLPNGNREYLFISTGTGVAFKFGKFFQ